MAEPVRLVDWSKGIDNRSPDNRLQEGFARDIVNLDPGATMSSRVGYERVVETEDCRAVMTLGDQVLFVDGDKLKRYVAGVVEELYTVSAAGPVGHTTHNGELFISTANATLRYDGKQVRRWGVSDVFMSPAPSVTPKEGVEGRQLFAMTYINEHGEEGGTGQPGSCPAGTLTFDIPTIPDGCRARIYVSPVNSTTLYLQGETASPGDMVIHRVDTNTQVLTTAGKYAPTPGSLLASDNGVILVAVGDAVYYTDPMTPHLVEYDKSFFQYPEKVTMLLSGMHGVYVGADKVYRITNVTTEEPRQDSADDVRSIPGTGANTPSGEAVWMSRYGMRRESPDPRDGIVPASSDRFHLGYHKNGATGVVEHNGQRRVVTTTKQIGGQGGLAAADYFEAEVIRP